MWGLSGLKGSARLEARVQALALQCDLRLRAAVSGPRLILCSGRVWCLQGPFQVTGFGFLFPWAPAMLSSWNPGALHASLSCPAGASQGGSRCCPVWAAGLAVASKPSRRNSLAWRLRGASISLWWQLPGPHVTVPCFLTQECLRQLLSAFCVRGPEAGGKEVGNERREGGILCVVLTLLRPLFLRVLGVISMGGVTVQAAPGVAGGLKWHCVWSASASLQPRLHV